MYRGLLRAVGAEAYKQHRTNYHSNFMYFSMFLWPIIQLMAAYYTYKPFAGTRASEVVAKWVGQDRIFAFIIFGYIGYMFFRCFVQSAWRFSYERISGTLELVYLTPASRMGVILGNALSSLFESVWLFTVFCIGSLFIFTDIRIANPFMPVIAVVVLIIPSICWGMFLNSLFLFTRDAGMLFTLFDEPMEVFGGVKVPFAAFPLWAKILGGIFPLTWSLSVIRKIFILGAGMRDISMELYILLGVCTLLFIITKILVVKGEKHSKKTGTMALF